MSRDGMSAPGCAAPCRPGPSADGGPTGVRALANAHAHSKVQTHTRRHCLCVAGAGLVAALLGHSGLANAQPTDALFAAVQRDDLSGLLLLDLRGVNLNTLDPHGQHALHVALRVPSLKVADYLAKQPRVDADVRNPQDETPLMLAVLKGHVAIARTLVGRDADVNKTGWTPLHYAATYAGPGAEEQVVLLLENHAYIDAESPNGTTPLMMAAQYGSETVVKLLLQEGADPKLTNQRKLSALDFAQRASRESVVELISAHVRSTQPKGKW